MTFAILAAGEGSRLEAEGILTPKPLIEVGGERLLDRLVRIFSSHGADKIVIVINSRMTAVREHLDEISPRCPFLRYVVADTPSSMHSLWAMRTLLLDDTFVLTTVDTIFREDDFARYLREGDFAVTPFVDDEKPLWVDTDADGRITAFRDNGPCPYVSAGIYRITPAMMRVLSDCIGRSESRMRNFQRAILRAGITVKAFPMERVYDIDHKEDIAKAERFLSRDILFVLRDKRFCKGRNDDDEIARSVGECLQSQGYSVTYTDESELSPSLLSLTWHSVLSMARSREALDTLSGSAAPVINTTEAVTGVSRRRDDGAKAPCWVKRSGYTQDPRDVVFAQTEDERLRVIAEMHSRGIDDIVCQRHHEGREVKFYGVAGRFFHPSGLPALQAAAESAANAAGLVIYGGDAILLREHPQTASDIAVIDLNDWPSFSRCREEAAQHIAQYAIHQK
jgi:choline kinase